MIKNRYIHYNHKADKKDLNKRWGKDVRVELTKVNEDLLPEFIVENRKKYSEWFD